MQHGGSHCVKSHRRECEHNHADPCIEMHDANPAFGSSLPGERSIVGANELGVSFFDAPIRIVEQLCCTHAGDPENRKRLRNSLRWNLDLQSVDNARKIGSVACEEESNRRDDGHQCHSNDNDRGQTLDASITATINQKNRRNTSHYGPRQLWSCEEILTQPSGCVTRCGRHVLPKRRKRGVEALPYATCHST